MKYPKQPDHTNRLDVEMQNRGIARSRSSASDLIKRGKVSINGKISTKPSQSVRQEDRIETTDAERFVSRAGEKLDYALKEFGVSPSLKVALDIGSSTGGFTDCLLKAGASKVISVDVGSDQMDADLKEDRRVELHEGTDIRKLSLPSPVELIVVDLSFISLTHVFPAISRALSEGGDCIILIKPQFEVGMEMAKKFKGVISDEKLRKDVIERISNEARSAGFKLIRVADSPIEGEKGNREYLMHLRKAFVASIQVSR